jgi:parallel beta-helix repeat protein
VLVTSSQSGLKDVILSPIREITTAQYQTSEPIVITSNVGFGLLDATGVGTPSDPYTFENLQISNTGSCIIIQDTNAHFLISNCKFDSGDTLPVIRFDNVENGRVEGCESNGGANGFLLVSSIDCIVAENSIYGTWSGVTLIATSNCTVSDNKLHNNDRGILLDLSNHCDILNNSIYSNAGYGIEINLLSHNNTIYGNSIGWNDVAVGFGGNAFDNGRNNTFDDGSNNGNFWDDYNSSETYTIPGNGNSTDVFAQLLEDIVNPVIVPLSDTAIDVETTSNELTWLAYDTLPKSYVIRVNNLVTVSSIWNGGDITYGLDNLPVGTHEFNLTVYDGAGNEATDGVLVSVVSFILGGIGTELVMIASGVTVLTFVVIVLLVKKMS